MPPRKCFICDGTGSRCNICGESEAACHCDPGEQDLFDCNNCGGDGVAPLDQEE